MPYQSIGDFPVNFMMNQFDLSDWYDNDESVTQLMGFLIPPCYLEMSIGDTQEHPLGVYLEKESLYFNIT
jgi:hypothetical protein